MSNTSRTWALIGLSGLIVIGIALILSPLLSPASPPVIPTPDSAARTVDQSRLPYPAVPRVAVGEARAAHELQQAALVDVRTAEEYARSHAAGALSIPFSEFDSRLNELNKAQWIITYCT